MTLSGGPPAVSTHDQIQLKAAERRFEANVGLTETESSRAAGQSPSRPERCNARLVAPVLPLSREKHINRQKPVDFRSSLNLANKVQVKILRRRFKLSDEQFK